MTLQTTPARKTLQLSLEQVYLVLAVLLPAICIMVIRIEPYDFWWHMAMGRQIIQTGEIPRFDTFSYTQAGAAFFDQSWLAQVFMYLCYSAGGLPLLIIVQAVVITVAYALLLRLSLRYTQDPRLSALLFMIGTLPISFGNWSIRPQSYTFPIFVAFLTVLTDYRQGRARRLWLLPLLMVLWANLHGAFVLGLVLIGAFFVGELVAVLRSPGGRASIFQRDSNRQLVELLICGIATAAAILVNPRGFELVGYVRTLLGSNQVTTLVTEWSPTTTRTLDGALFFAFTIAWFLTMAYTRRKPALADLILTLAFFWLALGAIRNMIWFAFVATPPFANMLAGRAEGLPKPSSSGSAPLNATLLVLLGMLLIASSPWVKPLLLPPELGGLVSAKTPVAAVAFLRNQPERPQRLFHESGIGSYLIWAAPEQKVFVDPRIELYPFKQWTDYVNLGQGNNVEQLLDQYQIDGAMLNVEQQKAMIEILAQSPAWKQVYSDKHTVYFIRQAR